MWIGCVERVCEEVITFANVNQAYPRSQMVMTMLLLMVAVVVIVVFVVEEEEEEEVKMICSHSSWCPFFSGRVLCPQQDQS